MQTSGTLRNRMLIAVLLLVVLIIAALVLGWLMSASDSGTSASAPAMSQLWYASGTTLSLEEAAHRADARAQQWAADAELIKAESSWRPTVDWKQTETPRVTWAFYYYSSSAGALASVAVKEDALAWVPPLEINLKPQGFPVFPPPYDVEVAWLSFLASGGEAFLKAHPEAMVNFNLQPQGADLIWTILAFQDAERLKVVVDAQSGLLIFSES